MGVQITREDVKNFTYHTRQTEQMDLWGHVWDTQYEVLGWRGKRIEYDAGGRWWWSTFGLDYFFVREGRAEDTERVGLC